MRPAPNVAKADASVRFDILLKLAEGGMAEILLARVIGMQGFSKYVVLKRILPSRAQDPGFVAMFLDEARLAARLHHQNIAQVHAIGEEDDSYFFSMEYLHGLDTRTLIRELAHKDRGLPLQHSVYLAAQTAAGLHYAHEKCDDTGKPLGIVHRDVSASNIFLTYDGAVKVVDFGIAWAERRHSTTQPGGGLKGKILYMSPEQADELPVDRRSDVYSLGAVLYELVVGRRPFEPRKPVREILGDIVAGRFARPLERNPNLPPELDRIVCKAMSRDAGDRYATCEELQDELEAFALRFSLPLSARSLKEFLEESVGRQPEPWLEGGLEPTEQICIANMDSYEGDISGLVSSISGMSAMEIPKHETVALDNQAQVEEVASEPPVFVAPPASQHSQHLPTEIAHLPAKRSRPWLAPILAGALTASVGAIVLLPILSSSDDAPNLADPTAATADATAEAKAKAEALVKAEALAKAEAIYRARAEEQARTEAAALAQEKALAEALALEKEQAIADAKVADEAKAELVAKELAEAQQKAVAVAKAEASAKSKAAAKAKAKAKAKARAKAEKEKRESNEGWTKDSIFLPSESR